MRCLIACVSLATIAFAARPADACGGLFCSSVQSTPVDQTQERFLFEVNAVGSVKDPSTGEWI